MGDRPWPSPPGLEEIFRHVVLDEVTLQGRRVAVECPRRIEQRLVVVLAGHLEFVVQAGHVERESARGAHDGVEVVTQRLAATPFEAVPSRAAPRPENCDAACVLSAVTASPTATKRLSAQPRCGKEMCVGRSEVPHAHQHLVPTCAQ